MHCLLNFTRVTGVSDPLSAGFGLLIASTTLWDQVALPASGSESKHTSALKWWSIARYVCEHPICVFRMLGI